MGAALAAPVIGKLGNTKTVTSNPTPTPPVAHPWVGMAPMPGIAMQPSQPFCGVAPVLGAAHNPLPQDNGSARLHAQAANFQAMAAHLMAQMYQARIQAYGAQAGTRTVAPVPLVPAHFPGMVGQSPGIIHGQTAVSSAMPNVASSPEQAVRNVQASSDSMCVNMKDTTRTTICLRNLPNDYTRDMIVEL